MNVTWIIGNGFDIRYGLKTKYHDFYTSSIVKSNNENIYYHEINQYLKDEKGIPLESINWADLEIALGEHSIKKPNYDEATVIADLKKVNADLQEYIRQQEQMCEEPTEAQINSFRNTIVNYHMSFTGRDRASFIQYLRDLKSTTNSDKIKLSYITFNYTNLFSKYWETLEMPFSARMDVGDTYNFEKNNGTTVHGTVGQGIILGCDNSSQYNINDYPRLKNVVEKPTLNLMAGHRYDEYAALTIDNTDIFILFGVSLGASDLTWWQRIAKTTSNRNSRIVILAFDETYNGQDIYHFEHNERYKDIFMDNITDFSEGARNNIRGRIIVSCRIDSIFCPEQ